MSKEQLALGSLMVLASALVVLSGGCGGASDTPTPSNTPTPSDTPTPDAVDPFAQNARLGRGVNLGNALEGPQEGDWGVTLQEEYFQLIKIAGFDAVRIPIRWSTHAAEAAPYTIAPSFFERVDWAIERSLSRELVTVVNVHHYEEIMQNPAAHEERLLALWEQIADHYKAYPADLIFEVLNEPSGELESDEWNRLLVKAISTIRQTNPNRTIIVGPAGWNGIDSLDSLELPEDGNLIVTVHYYLPMKFTHQGASWAADSNEWLGTKWIGSEEEKKAVSNSLTFPYYGKFLG